MPCSPGVSVPARTGVKHNYFCAASFSDGAAYEIIVIRSGVDPAQISNRVHSTLRPRMQVCKELPPDMQLQI